MCDRRRVQRERGIPRRLSLESIIARPRGDIQLFSTNTNQT
jgi:hypothetical protein